MQAMSDNLYANKHVACRTRNDADRYGAVSNGAVAVCVEKNCAETRRAEANCAETGPALSNYLFISSFVSYSNASMNASKIGKGPEWPKL